MANLKARLKHTLKVLQGKSAAIRVEIKRPKQWYGTDYGGFYIDPTLVPPNAIVYSFGIGEDISFDKMVIEQHGAQVFGFDPTPKSIAWIAKEELPINFSFYPFGIGVNTERIRFNLPKNKDHVSGSIHSHSLVDEMNSVEVLLKSFEDILQERGHSHVDVLKIDIEGSEFSVLPSILECEIPIRQILVEIHERFFEDGKAKAEILFSLLRKYGYQIFGVSDTYQEISFVKI